MTAKPRPASALPSPYVNPSAITRDDPAAPAGARADARAGARPGVRAYTRASGNPQAQAVAGRSVEAAGLALAAALAKVGERQDALAAAVAGARASELPDRDIRALLVTCKLGDAAIDAALRPDGDGQ